MDCDIVGLRERFPEKSWIERLVVFVECIMKLHVAAGKKCLNELTREVGELELRTLAGNG